MAPRLTKLEVLEAKRKTAAANLAEQKRIHGDAIKLAEQKGKDADRALTEEHAARTKREKAFLAARGYTPAKARTEVLRALNITQADIDRNALSRANERASSEDVILGMVQSLRARLEKAVHTAEDAARLKALQEVTHEAHYGPQGPSYGAPAVAVRNAESALRLVENEIRDEKRRLARAAEKKTEKPVFDKANEERLLEARRMLRDGFIVEAFSAKIKISR